VLAQNSADDGQRRFILVSSTEATEKEPHKNVCRDIAQRRLAAAINGYTYTTNKGPRSVDGLGDGCAYARTRRVPVGKVVRRVQHDQVWLALQLMHLPTCVPYAPGQVQQGCEEKLQLLYLPDNSAAHRRELHRLASLAETGQPVVIYTWQPTLVAQDDWPDHVTIEPIPQTLIERFGLRPTGRARTVRDSDS
jgi:adenine-specific DNA-methyltransferase